MHVEQIIVLESDLLFTFMKKSHSINFLQNLHLKMANG